MDFQVIPQHLKCNFPNLCLSDVMGRLLDIKSLKYWKGYLPKHYNLNQSNV